MGCACGAMHKGPAVRAPLRAAYSGISFFFTFRIVWCNFKLAAWFVMLHVKVFYLFFWFEIKGPAIEALNKGPPKPYYATVQLSCVCHKPVVYRSATWQIELVLACELPLTCCKLRGKEIRLPPKIRPLSSGTLSQTTDLKFRHGKSTGLSTELVVDGRVVVVVCGFVVWLVPTVVREISTVDLDNRFRP